MKLFAALTLALALALASISTSTSTLYFELAVQNWYNGTYQVHGLWPSYSNRSYPQYCDGSAYTNITGVQYQDMLNYWNVGPDNQEFWAHEWEKHGTCAQNATGIGQDEYFNQALDLFKALLPNNTWTCGQSSDCVVACYDLNFKPYACASASARELFLNHKV